MNRFFQLCLFFAALLYLLFPRDLVPDFLFGWGWIDDLVIMVLLWRYFRRLKQTRPDEARDRSHGTTDDQSSATATEHQASRDPYAVLEIPPGASQAEIKAAYRRLAGQYHPDKVQHLGEEFRKLAERRFKEIQQAYDRLR